MTKDLCNGSNIMKKRLKKKIDRENSINLLIRMSRDIGRTLEEAVDAAAEMAELDQYDYGQSYSDMRSLYFDLISILNRYENSIDS